MITPFLRFIFFSVGQGSCTLIGFPGEEEGAPREYAVVDCNQSNARSVLEYLEQPWFPGEGVIPTQPYNLKFAALTHYDSDHLCGIDVLLGCDKNTVSTNYFIHPLPPPLEIIHKFANNSLSYSQLLKIDELAFEPARMKRTLPESCIQTRWFTRNRQYEKDLFSPSYLNSYPLEIRALAPTDWICQKLRIFSEPTGIRNTNLISGALRIQFGESVVILGGDVQDRVWKEIRKELESKSRLEDMKSHVVLVPHHGGTGNPDEFWEIVSRQAPEDGAPEGDSGEEGKTIAVISCGMFKNLPSQETWNRLIQYNTSIRCTEPANACRRPGDSMPSCVSSFRIPRQTPPPLPRDIAYRGTPPAGLPPEILTKNLHPRRSICVDLFQRGEPRITLHEMGTCEFGGEDIDV